MMDRSSQLELGQRSITSAAAEALGEHGQVADDFITRHHHGDWGDVTDEDGEENEEGFRGGGWVRSAYVLNNGEIVWISTEPDRGRTIVHLAHELDWLIGS